jgi:hypothetical protein
MRSTGCRIVLLFLFVAMLGCANGEPYRVAVTVEPMVRNCTCLGYLSEISDMGAPQINPKFTYDAQERVLRKADMMNATHLVWMGDYSFAAAAMIYRCGN